MVVLPNLDWYLAIGARQKLSPRCPYASVYRCPRFYQSLSLLGAAGNTMIDPHEDDRLKHAWEKTDVWPSTAEQATTIAGPGDEIKHFSRFCPEVSYERFGLFATGLHRYTDEIDISVAHRQLSADKVLADDWRWNWSLIEPMHFTECPLFSLLKAGKGTNGPKPFLPDNDLTEPITTYQISIAQILSKYQGQRIKADNDTQLEQYFVNNRKLHYIDTGAALVCEKYGIVLQHLDAKEEFVFLEEDSKGSSYNASQVESILKKMGFTARENNYTEKTTNSVSEKTPDSPLQVLLHFLWPPDTLKKKAFLLMFLLIFACFAIWVTLPDKAKTDIIDSLKSRIIKTREGDNSKKQDVIAVDGEKVVHLDPTGKTVIGPFKPGEYNTLTITGRWSSGIDQPYWGPEGSKSDRYNNFNKWSALMEYTIADTGLLYTRFQYPGHSINLLPNMKITIYMNDEPYWTVDNTNDPDSPMRVILRK